MNVSRRNSGKLVTMTKLDEMKAVVRRVIEEKRKYNAELIKHGEIPRHYDLRDYANENQIYGMKKFYYINHGFQGDPNFNLGSCLTYEVRIPSYRFFKFKDLHDEWCKVWNECMKTRPYEFPLERIVSNIVETLANNSMYWQSIRGMELCCRICIFLYNEPFDGSLDELAEKFRERDLNEAKALSSYFNNRLVETCTRLAMTNR